MVRGQKTKVLALIFLLILLILLGFWGIKRFGGGVAINHGTTAEAAGLHTVASQAVNSICTGNAGHDTCDEHTQAVPSSDNTDPGSGSSDSQQSASSSHANSALSAETSTSPSLDAGQSAPSLNAAPNLPTGNCTKLKVGLVSTQYICGYGSRPTGNCKPLVPYNPTHDLYECS